ncbi:hypothetical protein [Bradyrhizobium australiense]|uniref:Uncharacterized protein n=1 Tax=Bradyrhizobium australiense TaxID=2721161 RepID=A0A7Y4LUP3_9BRAD|nr:hypothetical protein [Bradyrhizobium australiense]NOJ38910.1 hypothetical protein [Bradyrhizobium australiense]
MRSDPYLAPARALAVEAGLDPDAKIDRPGQRPMPTWRLFRDVQHTLRPFAVAIAGENEFDPFED